MSASPARSSRRLAVRCAAVLVALVTTGVAATLGASIFGGCTQAPVTVPTRSLERSGRSSFVCLAAPGLKDPDNPAKGEARPITDCTIQQVLNITDYAVDEDAGLPTQIPHLYGLVTQTTRGEVAVVDITAKNNPVLDEDPSVPGANFLPIGAQPVDIVSSPGGIATFVGVAEVGREGIFVLPSAKIRPQSASSSPAAAEVPAPQVSSWPACRLPSAPGQMLLLSDPDVNGQVRGSCDSAYGDVPAIGSNGDLGLEGKGRQKLVVAMPDAGGIVVIDAQSLLDRLPGSFDACPVERWLPLDATVPQVAPPPPPKGQACVNPKPEGPRYAPPYEARPSGISFAAGRLYASDLSAPLVHVIDLPTPCEPVEAAPLLPTSVLDPKRVVTTTRVAVAPTLTPDLKRYLYAVDAEDGSAMVFDVSDDQTSRFPAARRHPEWDPFEPPDRIRFAAPVADLLIVERDVPATHPATGVAPHGTRCDPDPGLTVCDPHSQSCDLATLYRTSSDYLSGAGPNKLRGEFAFLALSSGKLAVIDIDDYDAKCRAPKQYAALLGCPPPWSNANPEDPTQLASSLELSCNVVIPNAPRSATYDAFGTATGERIPGIQIYPLLYDDTGGLVPATDTTAPLMAAPPPVGPSNAPFSLGVGSALVKISDDGQIHDDGVKNTLVFNNEDPRAQLLNENWTVTFEGALPGFEQQAGGLSLQQAAMQNQATGALTDADGRFCDAGVISEQAVRAALKAQGLDAATIDADAPGLADYVQIAEALATQDDPRWSDAAVKNACTYDTCLKVFGNRDTPQRGRDFRITEAYQDHVELTSRDPSVFTTKDQANKDIQFPVAELTKCCFPTLVNFNVRAGGQWVVAGEVSGFLHHVIADPVTGVCRPSCDPRLERQNGRVPRSPPGAVKAIPKSLLNAFTNPMFRFGVIDGVEGGKPVAPKRDYQFRFTTQGAFSPLLVDLAAGVTVATSSTTTTTATPLIQPVGVSLVPATGEIAVTDGTINGLILVNLSSVAVSKTFF